MTKPDWDSWLFEHYEGALQHFRPHEFMTLGASHTDKQQPGFGLNVPPPPYLWPNIVPTIRVADALRAAIDSPIRILSAYRCPAYNRAVGGGRLSQHLGFRALDCGMDPNRIEEAWYWLIQERKRGRFTGGLGRYSTFIHIDTRAKNATW